MNRRSFLLLKTEPRARDVELSCEWLYMRCLDAQAAGAQHEEPVPSADEMLRDGEPPSVFAERTQQQLFEDLDRELRDVDVLRVTATEWLDDNLRRDFDQLIASFRARGGRVLLT